MSSSSELLSEIARFLPLGSCTGSLMVSAEEVDAALRRGLAGK